MKPGLLRLKRRYTRSRGQALILTVIVIMVLSAIGLAMVAFTTTEEKTSTAYRDGQQARMVAEAGVHIVEEMFYEATNRNLVPLYSSTASDCSGGTADYCGTTETATETSLNALGIWRASRSPMTPARYTGMNNKFFAGPFKDAWGQTFGGTYSSTASSDKYDVKFNCTNPSSGAAVSSSNCWLDSKINSLIQSSSDYNLSSGKITDISFYAAPSTGGYQYGICTVRVTAVKTDSSGAVLGREVLEAVLGDNNKQPAVFGNGNVKLATQAGELCGDGCESVWVNGNYEGGSIGSGAGTAPIVNVVGTSDQSGSNFQTGAATLTAPKINPWDLTYKPTTSAELAKYYLVAARQLDAVWTDGNPANNPAARACGLNNLSLCQDYNLEYDTSGTAKAARSATGTAYMYSWDTAGAGWSLCESAADGDNSIQCTGGPAFSISRGDDLTVTGTADTADIPFNKNRVPQTTFAISTYSTGATVLIDGNFSKSSSGEATMTLITAGHMSFTGSTHYWYPALSNKVMWVAGRDIYTHSNAWAPSNTCSSNMNDDYMAIIASHEQMLFSSQIAMAGVLVAENRVNLDTFVDSTYAIDHNQGDHGITCTGPSWPWTMPTLPKILSLKSVGD